MAGNEAGTGTTMCQQGGRAGVLALGIAAAWAGYRNRQYAGQNSALQQTSGVLAQNIATFMEVLKQTDQGKQLAPLLQNYLTTHQAEAGVIQQVAGLAGTVDPLQAKGAAAAILRSLEQLQGTQS